VISRASIRVRPAQVNKLAAAVVESK